MQARGPRAPQRRAVESFDGWVLRSLATRRLFAHRRRERPERSTSRACARMTRGSGYGIADRVVATEEDITFSSMPPFHVRRVDPYFRGGKSGCARRPRGAMRARAGRVVKAGDAVERGARHRHGAMKMEHTIGARRPAGECNPGRRRTGEGVRTMMVGEDEAMKLLWGSFAGGSRLAI